MYILSNIVWSPMCDDYTPTTGHNQPSPSKLRAIHKPVKPMVHRYLPMNRITVYTTSKAEILFLYVVIRTGTG